MGLIAYIIFQILSIFVFILIVNIILSWLINFGVVNRGNQFVDTVYFYSGQLTEPVMRPVRSIIPSFSGIDVSPILVVIVIDAVKRYLLAPMM